MKYVFKLIHSRIIEEPDINDALLIGFYSKREKAEKTIEKFKQIVGFKDFPQNFYIEKEKVNEGAIVREENTVSNNELKSVFFLSHMHEKDEYDFILSLGIFSSFEKAQQELDYLKNTDEYKEYPDEFYIAEYKIDEDNWESGFFVY